MEIERRQVGNLRFEPAAGLLVVGARTAVLDPAPTPEAVVGTYVELVVAQREVAPATHVDLRNRELVVLADLLALPEAELDALIDRELARLLGAPVVAGRPEAAPRIAGPRSPDSHRRHLRLLAVVGVLAVAGAVGTAVAIATSSAPELRLLREPHILDIPAGGTVEVVDLPDGSTATRTESAPAAPSVEGADIGTAVQLERNPP